MDLTSGNTPSSELKGPATVFISLIDLGIEVLLGIRKDNLPSVSITSHQLFFKWSFCRHISCLLSIIKERLEFCWFPSFEYWVSFQNLGGSWLHSVGQLSGEKKKLWKIYMHIFGGKCLWAECKNMAEWKKLCNAEWRKCNRPFEAPAPAPSVLPGLFSGQPPQNWTPLVLTIFHLS